VESLGLSEDLANKMVGKAREEARRLAQASETGTEAQAVLAGELDSESAKEGGLSSGSEGGVGALTGMDLAGAADEAGAAASESSQEVGEEAIQKGQEQAEEGSSETNGQSVS